MKEYEITMGLNEMVGRLEEEVGDDYRVALDLSSIGQLARPYAPDNRPEVVDIRECYGLKTPEKDLVRKDLGPKTRDFVALIREEDKIEPEREEEIVGLMGVLEEILDERINATMDRLDEERWDAIKSPYLKLSNWEVEQVIHGHNVIGQNIIGPIDLTDEPMVMGL